MATDSTKTETDTKPETDTEPEQKDPEREDAVPREHGKGEKTEVSDGEADPKTGAADDVVLSKDDEDDDLDDDLAAPHTSDGRGWGAGAAAVVSAGLGLASLTGTSFSEMLRERKQLIGQIESGAQGGGGGGDQINALYGAPWHATALVNGIFALVAVVIGGVLLAALSSRSDARPWVKAVGLGGVVLGVLGLIVAGGMYFDLFASAPELPTQGVGGGGAQ